MSEHSSDDKSYILYDGLYSYTKYKLKVEKDSSYVFSYSSDMPLYNSNYVFSYEKEVIISEGTWKRKDNILSLYDVSLQHPLYVFIEETGLNCKFLLGIYGDDLFILYKPMKIICDPVIYIPQSGNQFH